MLTPSQVPRLQKQKQKSPTADSIVYTACNSLIPSQVGGVKPRLSTSINSVNNIDQSDKTETKKNRQQKHGTRNNNNQKYSADSRSGGKESTRPNGPQARRTRKLSSGNLPDVLWRHIPLDHVRKHPHFVPLPEPESIHRLECIEDVRNFRQESWQWDVLHEGRMTTSQAVVALGFLEPNAGEILGVPKGLRRGGEGAYHRLRKPVAMTTLEEMNCKLCVGSDDGEDVVLDENKRDDDDNDNDDSNYWTQPANFPFAAKYMVQITEEELEIRRELAKKIAKTQWSIRMVWGNVQESTSLLTVLNYFSKHDKGVVMKEIGMCGAGLDFNQTSHSSTGLLLGATPDAILCHPDGKIEAVEVKNHCPFVPNAVRQNRNNDKRSKQQTNNTHAFRLSRQSLSTKGSMMCQYIPQLMMEMLCVGQNCESAIMVRQTATSGSLILRIKRDDDWIEEMIYWLDRFQQDFVQQEIPPPRNFFLEGGDHIDQERYRKFLKRTKQIESQVELLEHVPNYAVQRATSKHPVSNDLFLD